MRRLVNYIRQIFCKHDFYVEDGYAEKITRKGYRVYMRCKKCGYHNSHWKFL